MKTRAEWLDSQERLLSIYDQVREELCRIPGVVEVGVGLRRRAGALVEEAVFVVSVREKKPPRDLPPDEIIPSDIRGFATDVVVHRDPVPLLGFADENHKKNYKTKVGGIAINPEGSSGTGTLGCFCKRNSDNSIVLLTCHHVLFEGLAEVGSGVGQPGFDKVCCCTCNDMATVLAGDKNLDCAIASLKSGIPFFPKIRRIKKGDGTIEEEGAIKGTADPVLTEVVYKIGQRTGLTRGFVAKIAPRLEIETDAAFPRFCNSGDSGSVIIQKANGTVIGLLCAMTDPTGKTGVAKKITAVTAVLNITVLNTDPGTVYTESGMPEEEEDEDFPLPAASPFEALAGRLREFQEGREILAFVERHTEECMALVRARRGFTVAWHRNRGPAWLAAIGRSSREPIYRLPDEIQGVTRSVAIREITNALRLEASPRLREDVDAVLAPLGQKLGAAGTVDEWCDQLQAEHSPA